MKRPLLRRNWARLQEELARLGAEHASELGGKLAEAKTAVETSQAVKDFHGALAELLKFQTEDFRGIFRAMAGKPVVIRLIDPPFHEFLPSFEELLVEITELRVKGNEPAKLPKKKRC